MGLSLGFSQMCKFDSVDSGVDVRYGLYFLISKEGTTVGRRGMSRQNSQRQIFLLFNTSIEEWKFYFCISLPCLVFCHLHSYIILWLWFVVLFLEILEGLSDAGYLFNLFFFKFEWPEFKNRFQPTCFLPSFFIFYILFHLL